jgi:hypothetical protein
VEAPTPVCWVVLRRPNTKISLLARFLLVSGTFTRRPDAGGSASQWCRPRVAGVARKVRASGAPSRPSLQMDALQLFGLERGPRFIEAIANSPFGQDASRARPNVRSRATSPGEYGPSLSSKNGFAAVTGPPITQARSKRLWEGPGCRGMSC